MSVAHGRFVGGRTEMLQPATVVAKVARLHVIGQAGQVLVVARVRPGPRGGPGKARPSLALGGTGLIFERVGQGRSREG